MQEQNTSYSWFCAGLIRLPCRTVAERISHRKSLAQAIHQYRKKAKMTQERLGELADLNPKYIGEVERMEKNISVDALARVAKALKVRLRDLVRDA
jgi:DNA-binding XRE family transcriptional regulator